MKVLLLLLLVSCSDAYNKKPEEMPNLYEDYTFSCARASYKKGFKRGRHLYRCENKEVVCYVNGYFDEGGISCKLK